MNSKITIWLLLAILGIIVSTSILVKTPLAGVHWDSPIYLYQAKRFAETPYLTSYRLNAMEIKSQLDDLSHPKEEVYSESYWRFIRLGHISILGVIHKLVGDEAITASTFIYQFMYLVSLLAIVFLGLSCMKLYAPADKSMLWIGSIFSLILYFMSDGYSYMNGNLVSEIPALLFMSTGLLLFVRGVILKSIVLVALSGIFSFLAYVCRFETIIYFCFFILLLIPAIIFSPQKDLWWKGWVVFGFSAFISYVLFAIYFYPLADPKVMLDFARSIPGKYETDTFRGIKTIIAMGGMLWMGVFFSYIYGSKYKYKPLLLILGIYLLLIILVRAKGILNGTIEARAINDIIIPVTILSIVGVTCLAREFSKNNIQKKVITGAFIFISSMIGLTKDASYHYMRDMPGMWRLQYIRSYLVVPEFQKHTYFINTYREISSIIYNDNSPSILIWDPDIAQENMNIVRYYGTRHINSTNISLIPDPTNKTSCGEKMADHTYTMEPVIFCNYAESDEINEYITNGYNVLILSKKNNSQHMMDMFQGAVMFENDNIKLIRLSRFNKV